MRYETVNTAQAGGVRLEVVARRGEIVVWGAIALMLAILTVAWWIPSLTDAYLGTRLGIGNPVSLSLQGRAGLWLASLVPAVVLAFGLAQLAFFFRRVRRGDAFARGAANGVRRLGWSLLAAAIAVPLARMVVMSVLGAQTALDYVLAHLAPGPAVITLAVLGVAMLAFGKVMERAAELAEENASFL